jgi:subtilase family serine protease
MTMRSSRRLLITTIVMLMCLPTGAAAGVLLELGDILAAEPATASISVIDPGTGAKTVIAAGGLLTPEHKAVGVAFAPDGDIIVAHRTVGLIRVNPATGGQSIQSQGGHFRDPWAIAIDKNTGYIYVADSGYDNDRPEINEAGKIIRVHPASGAQQIIASGSPCTVFPTGVACQNTTSAGSYLSHPYGIAIDYTTSPTTLVVADMGSFNGQGAIIRIRPVVGGTQTLLWGPATASPPPQVVQSSPLGCPMGVAVEPDGNILTTAFTFPLPAAPTMPPPAGTYYGCAPPGIFRLDLENNLQTVFNTNAPAWVPDQAYAVGSVIHDQGQNQVHRVVTEGTSQIATPAWNGTLGGTTVDGSVVWENIGLGANWQVPFGVAVEPAPTALDPSAYNIIVGDEGYQMVFRLDAAGDFLPAPGPLASGIGNVTSVDVITYTPARGFKPLQPPGDLVPTALTGPTKTAAGAQISLKYSVKNAGTTPVAHSLLGVFLSSDNTITLGDTALGSVLVPALNPGATHTNTVMVPVPSNTSTGTVYFGVIANVDGATDEASEANNTRATAAVMIGLPDYTVKSVTANKAAVAAGGSFSVTHAVRNAAAAPNTAPPSVSELFLSNDNVLDGGDVSLGTVAVAAINPGASRSATRTVLVPGGTAPGQYWVIAVANTGDIVEVNDANNVGVSTKSIIVGPDLTPTTTPATPSAKTPGAIFNVTTAVKNQGGGAAGPFDVTVYLSTDAAFGGGDVAVGTRRVTAGLAAGATSSGPVTVTMPASQTAGTYFLIVRADAGNEVTEASETNNERANAVQFIVGTDLTPTATPATPTAKAPGATFNVTTRVKNLGGAAAAPFDVTVYLSTDATFGGGDLAVGTRRVIAGLAAGATSSGPVTVTIPANQSAGAYFLIVRADAAGEVTEANETNNERATAAAFMVGPDLTLTAATRNPATTTAGGAVTVKPSVKNQGAQATGTGFTVNVYLSTDTTFDGADVQVGTLSVGQLAARATFTGPIVATIPGGQGLGNYFLLVRADAAGEVGEANETNNVRSAGTLKIVP